MANPMEIYGRIKELGKNAKVEADAFMQGLAKKYTKENPAPDSVIQKGLNNIFAKYETKGSEGSLEAIANSSDYLVGFACVSLLVFAMAGMPVYYLPPAL